MRYLIIAILTLTTSLPGNSCTTFLLSRDGQHVFGRNYDWVTGNGFVATNLRGLSKWSLSGKSQALSWTSLYGSITFNQYGKEFPTGGMNEKGLVVELMWLDGTRYPEDTDPRPGIGVLQWIQYQLDNCSTIDEVIATDKKIRIDENAATPLHYLVADASGRAATIEFLNGKMVVHKDKTLPYPVLTNTRYDISAAELKKISAEKSDPAAYFNDNSLQRFATACNMIGKLKTQAGASLVDYAFGILKNVSQGSFTRWSIVYDITNLSIHFRTSDRMEIKSLGLKSFDFNCNAPVKVFDLNSVKTGWLDKSFTDFTASFNRTVLEKTIAESRPNVDISEATRERILDFAATIRCMGK